MPTKSRPNSGFIQGRLFTSIIGLTALVALLYFGATWGREYYKIQMCQTCTDRMFLIEDAKEKFRVSHPGGKPDMYSDLLAYLPFTGFPMCPWGGKYENELALDKKVTCSLNGDPVYEPSTPGVDLRRNGYMDLAKKRKSVSLFDYLYDKASWKNSDRDPLAKDEKQRKKLFGSPD